MKTAIVEKIGEVSLMTFEIRFPEIKKDQLIKIDTRDGFFYICGAGGKPELEHCFFYGDKKYQFFFYAKWVFLPRDSHGIEVYTATTGRLKGSNPFLSIEDIKYVEDNIREFFSKYRFLRPSQKIKPEDIPENITFTWSVGQ